MIIAIDLDGTLIDSTKRHVIVLKNAFDEFNIKEKIDEIDFFKYKRNGNSTKAYLRTRFSLTNEKVNEISDYWVRHIEDREMIELDVLYNDTICFLEHIKMKGKIIYLTARSNIENLYAEIEKLSINKYAAYIIVVNPDESIKAKSGEIKKMCINEQVIVIGDTEVDYFAAKSNSCDIFLLNRGFRSENFWADKDVKTYCNLFEIQKMI